MSLRAFCVNQRGERCWREAVQAVPRTSGGRDEVFGCVKRVFDAFDTVISRRVAMEWVDCRGYLWEDGLKDRSVH